MQKKRISYQAGNYPYIAVKAPKIPVEGLAEKLITVIKDNVLRLSMGKQAKEASRRYEEEAVMQLWMDIFQTVMKA